ncbi:hypothetical protein QBC46DRAFT_275316 [Diplogelasinospora grovesii]|uniref:DUF3295 domain-containing protein n=1 Tax=Diplogelasinospora grovesii TaxID=303347 RepID=A0AAN6MUG8_9PEZI|nr:hypothetical protein QBC46DRAFT_275316 [Diplogelasinospora grovesii]
MLLDRSSEGRSALEEKTVYLSPRVIIDDCDGSSDWEDLISSNSSFNEEIFQRVHPNISMAPHRSLIALMLEAKQASQASKSTSTFTRAWYIPQPTQMTSNPTCQDMLSPRKINRNMRDAELPESRRHVQLKREQDSANAVHRDRYTEKAYLTKSEHLNMIYYASMDHDGYHVRGW